MNFICAICLKTAENNFHELDIMDALSPQAQHLLWNEKIKDAVTRRCDFDQMPNIKSADYLATHVSNSKTIPMIKPISIFFRNGVVSQFLMITFKTFGFKSVYLSKGNINLHDILRFKALSHGEGCVERRDNATNGKKIEP